MIYARFDEKDGLYDLFEDAEGRAINSDLPVPSAGASANGIGVPASEAGRPLPTGVKFVGRSWHARGIVVSPGEGPSPLSGMTEGENKVVLLSLGFALALGLAVYFLNVPKGEEPARWRR